MKFNWNEMGYKIGPKGIENVCVCVRATMMLEKINFAKNFDFKHKFENTSYILLYVGTRWIDSNLALSSKMMTYET